MTRFPRLGIVLLFSLFLTGYAGAETVNLQPGQGISSLKPHMTYLSEPMLSLGDALKRYRSGDFHREMTTSMTDWNYAPEAWAAVEIFNATLDDGRGVDPFVLTLDLPLVSEAEIYVIRDSGFTENLLRYSLFEPFAPQQHSVTRLRTPVFEIAPQERVTVMVGFKFGPFQGFKMALETPVELETSAFASGISHTAFYSFAISCLIFFAGFHMALKNWIGLLYAVQFAFGLGLIALIDGLWFRFAVPDDPEYLGKIGFFLFFAVSGLGFFISSRSFVRDGRETGLSLALLALSLFSVAGYLASLYSPGTYVTIFGNLLIVLMFVSFFISSATWRRKEGDVHLSSMLISAFATLAVVFLVAVMIVGSRAEIIPSATAVKGIYFILLLSTMTGLTTHIVQLRRTHANAVASQLEALEAEAKRSQELLVAERNYTRARELASLRQRQLATASHDLKQPIMSLRMNIDTLTANVEPGVRQRLREAFDYIEALSNDYLRETSPAEDDPGSAEDGEGGAETTDAEQEVYEAGLVIDTVFEMFREEAVSKGVDLRRVPSTLKIAVPPLILMRIVSNLVSNAVKYTVSGRVLVGARRRKDRLLLCVCDTGPGMDEAEVAEFATAYRKGETSEGHGLGLAVCYELSRENGMELGCHSRKGCGTVFSLSVPLAAGP
ncbi:sensor histidine kinase [Roseibium aggregatum]|uniref:histidine kinase n=1 Tax=Roseibium aggregatum TaxID=187304 RepID=A0A939ED78_9HYPH|nr:ATP-binding protein [Roseibium aggregatum]MBN9671015.1 hypothetical protein [Roseibium aggregatum]